MNTTDKINQLRQRLSEAQLHSRRLHDQYMMAMAQECRIRERIEDLLSIPPDLNPETIARDCLTKPAQSDLPPSSSDTIAREAVLDQLTSEAQADNMGYDND